MSDSPLLAALQKMRGIEDAPLGNRPQPPKFYAAELYAGEGTLARLALSREYRKWWDENLPSPYGYCACDCKRPTVTASRDDPGRGLVAGEKTPFLDSHAALYGLEVSDPERRCGCGCGSIPPPAAATRREDGVITEFRGMRRARVPRHEATERVSRLDDPLGVAGTNVGGIFSNSPLASGYCAAIIDHRGRFDPSGGLDIRSARANALRLFTVFTNRGEITRRDPHGGAAKPQYRWRSASLLERANVLFRLYPCLSESARRNVAHALEAGGFPPPDPAASEFAESVVRREEVERGWLVGTLAVRSCIHDGTMRMKGLTEEACERLSCSLVEIDFSAIKGSGEPRGRLNTGDGRKERHEAILKDPDEAAALLRDYGMLLADVGGIGG